MLLVLIILSIVSVCITIVTTYFLLNSEDYRWQWVSFLSSGSTAFYVFLYSVYYFFAKTNMSGLMQTTYYFGYMGLFCFAMCVVSLSLCVCVSLFLFLSIYLCVSLSAILRVRAISPHHVSFLFTHRWIMCGTIGRAGADLFVRSIFRNVKFD